MRTPAYSSQFKRDMKRCRKRGKNLDKVKAILRALVEEERLPAARRDHPLVGNCRGRRECHIEANWLLIYKLDREVIIFERTGTHADLFRE